MLRDANVRTKLATGLDRHRLEERGPIRMRQDCIAQCVHSIDVAREHLVKAREEKEVTEQSIERVQQAIDNIRNVLEEAEE